MSEGHVCPLNICDGSGLMADIDGDETGSYVAGDRPCPCTEEGDYDPEI